MINTVQRKTFLEMPLRLREVLRYASASGDTKFLPVINEVYDEMKNDLYYKVCFREFPVSCVNGGLDLGLGVVHSADLEKYLSGVSRILVFAASVGLSPDKTVIKYQNISPVKALFANAIGAERVESLCDTFCSYYESENNVKLKQRYSPGYGDFELSYQTNIISALECRKHIGVTLNESLLLSPSKSVTAIAGIL